MLGVACRSRDGLDQILDLRRRQSGAGQKAANGQCRIMARAFAGPVPREQADRGQQTGALQQIVVGNLGRIAVLVPADLLVALVNAARENRLRALLAADAHLQQHRLVSGSRRILELDRRLVVLRCGRELAVIEPV